MTRGWSKLSIALHWLIAVLVLNQILMAEGIGFAFFQKVNDKPYSSSVWLFHIIPGILILLFALVRLRDRFTHGRPALPDAGAPWERLLARFVHFALWVAIIVMPAVGILAWFGEIGPLASLHESGQWPLIGLIVLHVAGSLHQHFVKKTGVLRRIFVPGTE